MRLKTHTPKAFFKPRHWKQTLAAIFLGVIFPATTVLLSPISLAEISRSTANSSGKLYYMTCHAEVDDPAVLYEADRNSLIQREMGRRRDLGIIAQEIITSGDTQFLRGKMYNLAGRQIFKGQEFPEANRDQLFVLSNEWSCSLYRGDKAWPPRSP